MISGVSAQKYASTRLAQSHQLNSALYIDTLILEIYNFALTDYTVRI